MSATTAILALSVYLVLYHVPLNPLRFRWGIHRGLAPMPPEMEERAKSLDWVADLGLHLALLSAIVILARTSSVSLRSIGVIGGNWREALTFGAVFSLIPVALIAVLRGLPGASKGANLYSDVSSAQQMGLQVLRLLSSELWRAFSIVGLLRSELPVWAAVAITAVVWAIPSCYQSGWTCAGAAISGLVLGFVFVETNSLLAPLSLGFITAGCTIFLYSRKARPLVCPSCGHAVPNTRRPRTRWIICPGCKAQLTVSIPLWIVNTAAAMGALATVSYLLYARGFDLVSAAVMFPLIFIAWVFVSAFALSLFFPHAAKAEMAPVDRSLFHF